MSGVRYIDFVYRVQIDTGYTHDTTYDDTLKIKSFYLELFPDVKFEVKIVKVVSIST